MFLRTRMILFMKFLFPFRESKGTLSEGFSIRKKDKIFRVEKSVAQRSFGVVGG